MLGGIITAIIIPKTLGPAHYGDFNFLRDSFASLVNTIDLNSSNAHFIYSSRNSESRKISLFYLYICALVGVILISIVSVFYLTGSTNYLWPGQKISYIYAGAALGFFVYLTANLTNLSDSKGLTVTIEKYRMVITFVSIIALIMLFCLKWLSLPVYFSYALVLQFVLMAYFVYSLKRNSIFDFRPRKMSAGEVKEVAGYFYNYSSPLIVVLIAGFGINYFDRWFLQLIDGSVTQGYYSLSLRLSAVCALFTSAMTPLFMQSTARAHAEGRPEHIRIIFDKIQVFFFMAALIAVYFSLLSKEIVDIIGANEYSGAIVPITIMMLYPVHQTYGRFCGAVLLSTERTDLYRNITIFASLIGLPLSFILIAPERYFGFNLGATGLALKMVLIQAISVNMMLFAACRLIGESFMKFFSRQIGVLTILSALGLMASFIGGSLAWGDGKTGSLLKLGFSGPLYLMAALLLCLLFPWVLGLTREELFNYARAFLIYLRQGKKCNSR